MSSPQVILYAKWYSDCSARLRLALQLKDINYVYISVDEPNAAAYKEINPSGLVPTHSPRWSIWKRDIRHQKPEKVSSRQKRTQKGEQQFAA
ncbi:uncharacterized protein NFIA_095120 [Aspergillus fischeri NRRL 181]|uniref:GST N-terminal domain-containing protein n=1 Tax=Neosartorya fischeri (strain ATCC 1020 / DSM 3700 / CBS 544.65 / FGSC A1164 / JCM 1740 / NRRL 181 / WB 181) TaxID=331117 RepID=A1DAK2_NEOFI|nr:uncharacterized protein NFIA_095120 [Aspergillus fischeri NRRL 181]EAW19892.1 hypothetical protein NFIA_095120 [Aspergillus fischeri NRRL 181]